jgi:hypothetical protein
MPGPEPGSPTHNTRPTELMVLRCITEWGTHPRWRHLDMENFLIETFGVGHVMAIDVIAQARLALQESAAKPELADLLVHAYLKAYEDAGALALKAEAEGKLSTAIRCIEVQARIASQLARHMGFDAPMRVELTPPGVAKPEADRFAELTFEELLVLEKIGYRAQDTTEAKHG